MSARFASMRTLLQFIESKNWVIGQGFTVGNRQTPEPSLHGLPLLPTKALTSGGINKSNIVSVKETHFECPRNQELFRPPLILIKEHASLPMAFWDDGCISYQHKIVGIHASIKDKDSLRHLFDTLLDRHHLYQFCCLLNGSQGLVGKATAILRGDIDDLPYPEDKRELDLSFWEKVLVDDALQYMAPFVRLGQNSEALELQARADQVRAYAEMFCRMLGSVYRNLKSSDSINANGLILQPFYFGEQPRIEWNLNGRRKQLDQLIYKQQQGSLRTVRVVRFYDENVLLIVKPDRLRYWIRSTAIRDADETLFDLRRRGY
jgi:hypothetical protein